jgi:arylsulfatase A-like enzyme
MIPFRSLLAVICFLCFISSCNDPKNNKGEISEPPDQPNIIFFITDDMLPDMFNFLPQGAGKNLTPNIDRLAKEGMVMMGQHVVSPVCTPSRYNCITGRYASRATNDNFLRTTDKNEGQTLIQWNTMVTENDKILPKYLMEAGYATGMVGKNHVIEVKGLHRFPDFNADPENPEIEKKIKENYSLVVQTIKNRGFDYAGGIYHNNPWFVAVDKTAVHNLDWITAAGLEFIDQNHDKPFFLYFATTVPHGPGDAARSWNADPRITANGFLDNLPDVLPPRQTIPERIKEAGLEGKRKENILWLDDALGALIDKLEAYEIIDNTIIFFFNDHGQMAKGTLYQGGVLNPSIIWKVGRFIGGDISDVKITNVDFAPTILDLAGIEFQAEAFDGHSFKNVLEGENTQKKQSLFFELGFGRAVIKGKYKYYAIRYPQYANNWSDDERASALKAYNDRRRALNRKIVNDDPSLPFSHMQLLPGGGEAEHRSYGKKPGYFESDQLYDLDTDPEEMVNLVTDPDYQEVLIDLKTELQIYLDDLPGKFDL